MNRNQRQYGRPVKRDDLVGKSRSHRLSHHEIEEVMPPRNKRNPFKTDKPMTNRCCHITPVQKDVEQLTEIDDNFSDLVKQQYDFDSVIPDRIKQLNELRNVRCRGISKVENSAQCAKQTFAPSYVQTLDGSQWRNVDNAVELEQFLKAEREDEFTSNRNSTSTLHISDVPRVKIIAEKFSKFTKNNVELRKLEEKIVCIEYDIFASNMHYAKPFQIMRAYFSVKPMLINNNENVTLPSTIKQKFDIADDDLGKLNKREVEIIDAKISENKPYLDDLKKVLKRKQAIYAKKKKSTLDLMSLYEMAKRDTPSLDDDFSNTNLLSKAELEEIKDLITKNCTSSIHGISRRTVKSEDRKNDCVHVISQSIYEELVRNDK